MRVKFTVSGEPKGKGRPRFFKNKVYTPVETKQYENLIRYEYEQQTGNKYLNGYLKLDIKAYYSIAKSDTKKVKEAKLKNEIRPTKKPDIDNIVKMIDALNNIAFKDDSQILEITAKKYFSDNPRVEFILEEIS